MVRSRPSPGLDLNYYIPCRAQKHTIAVLGLGKTVEGDFLTSEDVELLETLAGYLGIAIQNARLYASLRTESRRIRTAERLQREHRGVHQRGRAGGGSGGSRRVLELANGSDVRAARDGRRLRRPLSEVFPAAFVEEFYRVRQNPGIHNLYKFRLGTQTRTKAGWSMWPSRRWSRKRFQRDWPADHHG